jgi:hypothetical protein
VPKSLGHHSTLGFTFNMESSDQGHHDAFDSLGSPVVAGSPGILCEPRRRCPASLIHKATMGNDCPEITTGQQQPNLNSGRMVRMRTVQRSQCQGEIDAWLMSNWSNPYPPLAVLLGFTEKWDIPRQKVRRYFADRRTHFFAGQAPAVSPESERS